MKDDLPESFAEYLDVWCADLLGTLSEPEMRSVRDALSTSYWGGPFPTRLQVQRLCETARGRISADAVVGIELAEEPGGLASALWGLQLDSTHDAAIEQLSCMPGTPGMVRAVHAAQAEGHLTEAEAARVLSSALRQPIVPAPVPLPTHLREVPADYPESFDEWAQRSPYVALPATSGVVESWLERPAS